MYYKFIFLVAEWRFKAGEIAISLLLDLSLFLNKYDHRYKRFVSLRICVTRKNLPKAKQTQGLSAFTKVTV